jgi:hypothetical protein
VRIEFAKTGTPSRALVVSHVSPQFTPDSWASQFATYGPVTQLQFNAAQGSCRVEFATVAAAVLAHNSLQGQVIAGQALELSFTEGPAPAPQPQTQRAPPQAPPAARGASDGLQPTRVVWVGLPNGSHVTKEEMEAAFGPVGGLEAARTLMDRNYAFLEFHTVDDAARCIQRMQGYTLHTRASGPIRLTLKFSSASAAAVQGHPPPVVAPQQPAGRARRGGGAAAPTSGNRSPGRRQRRSRSRSRSRSRTPPRRFKRSGWDQATPVDGVVAPATRAVPAPPPLLPSMPGPPPAAIHPLSLQPPPFGASQPAVPSSWMPPGMPAGGMLAAGSGQGGFVFPPPAIPQQPPFQPVPAMAAGAPSAALHIGYPPFPGAPPPQMQQQQQQQQQQHMNGALTGMQPGGPGMMPGLPQPMMPVPASFAPQPDAQAPAPGGMGQRGMTLAPQLQASAMGAGPSGVPSDDTFSAEPLPVELGGPGWRGRVSKSGAAVCSLACVRGVPGPLPADLNCAARTDLQSLAAHLASVTWRMIQLAPASTADVAPLQGFITYLRDRERAGVVNAGNTTLFLVPPSEWAGSVLRCEPTANLIAVILSSAAVPLAEPHQTARYQKPPAAMDAGAALSSGLPSAAELARLVAMAGGGHR